MAQKLNCGCTGKCLFESENNPEFYAVPPIGLMLVVGVLVGTLLVSELGSAVTMFAVITAAVAFALSLVFLVITLCEKSRQLEANRARVENPDTWRQHAKLNGTKI